MHGPISDNPLGNIKLCRCDVTMCTSILTSDSVPGQKFVEDIGDEAVVTQEARLQGNQMVLLLAPNKTK